MAIRTSVGLPLVVKIFPRLLTGAVNKSSAIDRERYLERMAMSPDNRMLAASNEDAFDTAVSALVMANTIDELVALAPEPAYTVEGKIWEPHASTLPRAGHESDPNLTQTQNEAPSGASLLAQMASLSHGRYWARTSDPQLVELVLSQLS